MTTAPDPGDWDQALTDLLAAEEASADGAGLGGFEAGEQAPEVAVLVLGVGEPWLLAALLKGPQIAARALAAEGIGLAVLEDPAEEAALEAARTASGTLRGQQLLLLRRGESADPAAGDVQAYIYVDGQEVQRVSPGLVLAQAPQLLEDLLIDPAAAARALDRAIRVADVSAAEAIGIIGRSVGSARKARRGRRPRAAGDSGGTA
ncbi:MAG: hypothetical protein LBS27_05720 [Bifidobacteriaceae bacterium]|jgi:hypothetical protein|nr:hypothetical protein [Bifidobacteriaceae bacterium]